MVINYGFSPVINDFTPIPTEFKSEVVFWGKIQKLIQKRELAVAIVKLSAGIINCVDRGDLLLNLEKSPQKPPQ